MGKHSEYKGVGFNKPQKENQKGWYSHMWLKDGTRWRANFFTEREAAVAYDVKMIELGKEPVNILKKK